MASAFDVAKYILKKSGPMTAMKLQKLVYYSQAWHTTWREETLFDEKVLAWANGPVVRELYEKHRGRFKVDYTTFQEGKIGELTADEKDSINKVLEYYGKKSAQWLSDLSHMEEPWKSARGNLAPSERSDAEITPAAMIEYYGSL